MHLCLSIKHFLGFLFFYHPFACSVTRPAQRSMIRERERTKFLQSENKWLQPLQLQSGMVTIREISVRDELIVSEQIEGLRNQYGTLLLPHGLTSEMKERIERNKQLPASVLFDSEGRVHHLVLAGKYFMMMMDVWKNVYVLKKVETEILDFDRRTFTLVTVFQNSTRFTMPHKCLDDLEGWVPQGMYLIEYDDDGRVWRISQPAPHFGANATILPVGLRWDSRFLTDPFSLIDRPAPQLRRVPRIQKREDVQEIEVEEPGMVII